MRSLSNGVNSQPDLKNLTVDRVGPIRKTLPDRFYPIANHNYTVVCCMLYDTKAALRVYCLTALHSP